MGVDFISREAAQPRQGQAPKGRLATSVARSEVNRG